MALFVRLSCLAVVLVCAVSHKASARVGVSPQVYGKYYSKASYGAKTTVDNSYYLFRPEGFNAKSAAKLPVIIEFHGGGFTGGSPATEANANIQAAVRNGIAYISAGYRLVATKYYYNNDVVEELIHVDAEGKLTLDTTGKTMDDYHIRRGRQEYNTKCSYDAAQMMEHLIAHADGLGIDVQRISFTGGSAGGGEINYLTWVYHQWNVGRYTPRGMVYSMAQLDYPVQNILDRVWKLWTDDVGEDTKLSTILSKGDCSMIVGNPWCGGKQHSDYNLCNQTYQKEAMGRFCGDAFERTTLAEVRDALVWPRDDPEVGRGMEVLWYTSLNMQKHAPKPFYLYIANALNSTAGMNVVHNALYSRNYGKYAEKAGINYTVYYTDYNGMTKEDAGAQRFEAPGRGGRAVVWNYRSSHDWIHQPHVQEQQRTGPAEELLYHCMALGVTCSVSPSPSPSPGPPSPASAACKKTIDSQCPSQRNRQSCSACIRSNKATMIAGGCPSAAEGGLRTCVAYCVSRQSMDAPLLV